MTMMDELMRRLPTILHVVMTTLTIPYVMFACFFIVVGRTASQRGLWNALDAFLQSLNWVVGWGFLLFVLVFAGILVAGFFESLRWWGSLALLTVLSAALGILIFYRPTIPTLDEFVFFAPGFLFIGVCCCQLILAK